MTKANANRTPSLLTMVMLSVFLGCASAVADSPAVEFAFVPASDAQPNGPAYDFRIGLHEIRNDQFVAFLNDAIDNLSDPRGYYMYFDTDSGDVYINSDQTGVTGTAGSGTLMFEAAVNGHVIYEAGTYRLADDAYAAHPVTGVTWFGAVKYCNWLTLYTGLAPGQRAYSEGGTVNAWHPVTITDDDWDLRDLTIDERLDLVENYTGYRLPMDEAADAAADYNEWYKAGAWDEAAGINHDYGFGRDEIGPTDANYYGSGDPFDDSTTPVGFYDGTLYNPGGGGEIGDGSEFQSTAETNAYNLFDMSGNVWEWMQDQPPSDPAKRRFRGGSWENGTFLLDLFWAAVAGTPQDADDTKGFRVAQCVADGFLVTPPELTVSGPWGGPYEQQDSLIYTIRNVSNAAADMEVLADAGWAGLIFDPDLNLEPFSTATASVQIMHDCGADGLTVGANTATLTFQLLPEGPLLERPVTLTVSEPLELTPGSGLTATMLFASTPNPTDIAYTLTSASETAVDWSLSIDPPETDWLTLPTAGTVAALGQDDVTVEINQTISTTLAPGLYQATVTFTDDCTATTWDRAASLEVGVPFTIDNPTGVTSTGIYGGPFDQYAHVFQITSATDVTAFWHLAFDPAQPTWLDVDVTGDQQLMGMESADVSADINSAADQLTVGSHVVTLQFVENSTGFEIDRTVAVEVVDYVTPTADTGISGPLDGPFEPATVVYTLENLEPYAQVFVQVSATYDPPGAEWLDVPAGLFFLADPPDDSDDVTLTINAVAETLDAGRYTADVLFTRPDLAEITSTRTITLDVGGEAFAVEMVNVPVAAQDDQPDGPAYHYRIGKYEITNAEFVRFLNDARYDALSQSPTGRSHYMYFDDLTGDVYVNDAQAGAVGTGPGGLTLLMFSPAVTGQIEHADGIYIVDSEHETHPVAGVSWYGAVKFCNWLTLIQGMSPDERVYPEGTTAADWYPVLSNAEIAADYRGFRLPMDDEATAASAYNEWYKAAAWNQENQVNTIYGFGRDDLNDADANFLDSDDPFEIGSTPVGYFDGVNALCCGAGLTANTENGFGLYDLTGNVAEWMHDAFEAIDPSQRAIRGGHFNNVSGASLLTAAGREARAAASMVSFVGLRLAQSLDPVDLNITPESAQRVDGFAGDDFQTQTITFDLQNTADYTVDDLTITIDVPWLEFHGVPPAQVPPGSTVPLNLRINENALTLGVSLVPPGDRALVRGGETAPESVLNGFYQPYGPEHDFWIGVSEVTNVEFTSFLNDTYTLAFDGIEDDRGAYMYFDTDSGSVYINDTTQGEIGTDAPSGDVTTLLYDAATGQVAFDDDSYVVEAGFDDHPVVGVTWYGAVKYCNWLTLGIGSPAGLIAYAEAAAPNLGEWRPVTADNFADGFFTADERADWVTQTLGYRLPMDGIATTAGLYNEWYKAAAWNYISTQNRDYGFGRSSLGSVDANYLDSGDTEEDGTTVIKFFDGTNMLFDGATLTTDTDNGYSLYDLCGNVAEWTTDVCTSGDASLRAVRGGSWNDAVDTGFLRNDGRAELAPETVNNTAGFRVVRGTGHVATVTITDHISGTTFERYIILDLREPLAVTPRTSLADQGLYAEPFADLSEQYTITNLSESAIGWRVTVDQSWVELSEVGSGEPPASEINGTIAGEQGTVDVLVSMSDEVATLLPGNHVAIVTFANETTGQSETREIKLTIDQPIVVTPDETAPQEFTGYYGGPFDPPPGGLTYVLARNQEFGQPLDYLIEANQDWITIDSTDPLSGALPLEGELSFDISVNDNANILAVGTYEATISFTWTDPNNGNLGDTIDRAVTLVIDDLISIDPTETWEILPEDPQFRDYTLTNHHGSEPITVFIEADQDWLDIANDAPTVLAGMDEVVQVSVNENAEQLYPGTYEAVLTFLDTFNGQEQTRTVQLTVGAGGTLSVTPFTEFAAAGKVGAGLFTPASAVYTLTNIAGGGSLSYAASTDPPVDWLTINGQSSENGGLAAGETVHLLIAIDSETAASLPVAEYSTVLSLAWTGNPAER